MLVEKNSHITDTMNLYQHFKTMSYQEQTSFALSLKSKEEQQFFLHLAETLLREQFKKQIKKKVY